MAIPAEHGTAARMARHSRSISQPRSVQNFLALDAIYSRGQQILSACFIRASLFVLVALPFMVVNGNLLQARPVTADDLLEPEEAFRFSAWSTPSSGVEIEFAIADGYYLYRDKFKFAADPPTVKFAPAQMPPGEVHEDKFFGRSETYRTQLRITLPIQSAIREFKLIATSQGCADLGVCYPPQDHEVAIRLAAVTDLPVTSESAVPGTTPQAESPAQGASDEYFSRLVRSGGLWTTVLAFFGAGLLLAFTPCVLPMVPILSGIIVGQGQMTRGRAFSLSLSYVLGMAVSYTAIGIAAALSGSLISNLLQNPWALGAFAALLIALALSMFGLFELQLPRVLVSRLDGTRGRLRGGTTASVALMGVLSAAIVSPCVAAPLAGALLYIGQTGDAFVGGIALFSMALGMGIPLLLVGVSGAAFLPKAGRWMNAVRHFFGVLLLALAIWMISPVLTVPAQMALWAALLIGIAVFLGALDFLPPDAPAFARLCKTVGVFALIAGMAEGFGALSGATDPLQPIATERPSRTIAAQPVRFEGLRNLAELESRLANPRAPVMLDFSAEWCVACKEMERFTLSDPRVQARLMDMLLLRADVTRNTPEDKLLMKRFRLFGPPGIIFFDGTGRELIEARVIGYQPPEKFLSILERVAQGKL